MKIAGKKDNMASDFKKVSAVKCDSYLKTDTVEALNRAVDLVGGFKHIRPD
ncbi:MAG: hypothetical protein U5N58_01215 [Actinomycetota bacterium]|nr:hypothetical protein [Actinomycetota bacterium]